MFKFSIFNSGVFSAVNVVDEENDSPLHRAIPLYHELPADWDGKNTYNPDHLPQDWDGKNKPAVETPVASDITPPYTPELPADWDGKNTYNPDHLPQDWDGKNKPSIENVLYMDDNSIDHLLQSNFEPVQESVSGAHIEASPVSIAFSSEDISYFQKSPNTDF